MLTTIITPIPEEECTNSPIASSALVEEQPGTPYPNHLEDRPNAPDFRDPNGEIDELFLHTETDYLSYESDKEQEVPSNQDLSNEASEIQKDPNSEENVPNEFKCRVVVKRYSSQPAELPPPAEDLRPLPPPIDLPPIEEFQNQALDISGRKRKSKPKSKNNKKSKVDIPKYFGKKALKHLPVNTRLDLTGKKDILSENPTHVVLNINEEINEYRINVNSEYKLRELYGLILRNVNLKGHRLLQFNKYIEGKYLFIGIIC